MRIWGRGFCVLGSEELTANQFLPQLQGRLNFLGWFQSFCFLEVCPFLLKPWTC